MDRSAETREPAVAGQFYAAKPDVLQGRISEYLNAPTPRIRQPVRALIVPHAGHQYSGPTAGKAYALLQGQATVERAVIIAPSHRVAFRGISVGLYQSFRTPLGDVAVDLEGCRRLIDVGGLFNGRTDCHDDEHAIEVQLPFIQSVLPDVEIIPLVCGDLKPDDLTDAASLLRDQLWRNDTVWIISSDFTHYGHAFGYVPFLENVPDRLADLDMGAVEAIQALDLDRFSAYVHETGATICGRLPIQILLSCLAPVRDLYHVNLLEYTTSGDMTHDYSHSVSYISLAVCAADGGEELKAEKAEQMLSDEDKAFVLYLARETIRAELEFEPLPDPAEIQALSDNLKQANACFVSLHTNGRLRGCIGSLQATEPLYRNVINNARGAAFQDPRFMPLQKQELENVTIEISVLTPPLPIAGPEEFEVGRHGIILRKGRYRSVFLPQVAPEQGWDRETTLDHLALKAGLRADAWRKGASFDVFEAVVFGENVHSGQ